MGGSFCLEVTEDTALEHYGGIAENLRYLSEHGVMAAIDDFSMGPTLPQVFAGEQLPVRQAGRRAGAPAVGQPRQPGQLSGPLTGLGDLHFKVVAEYVENEKLQDVLAGLAAACFRGISTARRSLG